MYKLIVNLIEQHPTQEKGYTAQYGVMLDRWRQLEFVRISPIFLLDLFIISYRMIVNTDSAPKTPILEACLPDATRSLLTASPSPPPDPFN